MVEIGELVKGVNILLERADLNECPSFDTNGNMAVEVGEIIRGINSLLHGCVG